MERGGDGDPGTRGALVSREPALSTELSWKQERVLLAWSQQNRHSGSAGSPVREVLTLPDLVQPALEHG